jgi:hypothetical protein
MLHFSFITRPYNVFESSVLRMLMHVTTYCTNGDTMHVRKKLYFYAHVRRTKDKAGPLHTYGGAGWRGGIASNYSRPQH